MEGEVQVDAEQVIEVCDIGGAEGITGVSGTVPGGGIIVETPLRHVDGRISNGEGVTAAKVKLF